jgi:hypothetical protein
MDDTDHGCLLQPHDLAFRHCHGYRWAPHLPSQASFAAEFVRPQDCDDGFFALLGNNGDFDLAIPDIENCIRGAALYEERVALFIFENGSAAVFGAQKNFRIKRRLSLAFSNVNSLHYSTPPSRARSCGEVMKRSTESLQTLRNSYVKDLSSFARARRT